MSGLLAKIPLRSKKNRKSKEPEASVHIDKPKTQNPSARDEDSSDIEEEFMIVSSEECTPEIIDQPLSSSQLGFTNPQPHQPSTSIMEVVVESSNVSSGGACASATNVTGVADEVEDTDISKIPITALGYRTRCMISQHLNPPRPVRGNCWKGVADFLGFQNLEIQNLELEKDPTAAVLKQWETQAGSTVGELNRALNDLQRYDVLTELEKPIEIDVKRWKERKSRSEAQPLQVAEVSGSSTSYPNRPRTPEKIQRGLTINDRRDGPVETFDAYVCYNSAQNSKDYEFVLKIMEKMEKAPYNLKLCTDFRDLVPGGCYYKDTAELIDNRCKRMIVVLSPEFVENEGCDFHIKFALSLSPGARSRRMVLVMLQHCEPPPILRFITVCDYTREPLRSFFWPRLYAALNLD